MTRTYTTMVICIQVVIAMAAFPLLENGNTFSSNQPTPPTSVALQRAAIADAQDDDPRTKEYSFRAKLNGPKLQLEFTAGSERDWLEAKVKPLSTGQMLVGVHKVLYLLNRNHQVQWQFTVAQELYDFAAVESTGLVYATSGDNAMYIVSLSNGKEVYGNGRTGSAAYGQVEPFGKDQCLILDDFQGYRMKMSDNELNDPSWWKRPTMSDGLTAWRGTKKLWHRDFPPDANLLVKGSTIYAVTKTRTSLYIRKIDRPEK
jgi:hypothetical protein